MLFLEYIHETSKESNKDTLKMLETEKNSFYDEEQKKRFRVQVSKKWKIFHINYTCVDK